MTVDRVGVVGAGLIGTSIGLALARRGQRVLLVDADSTRAAAAEALGAGDAGEWADLAGCDHVVAAVPPARIAEVIRELGHLNLDLTMSDVGSVKSQVLAEVETLNPNVSSRFCGGHPIAGRERGGPGAAQPELFDGSVWVVSPLASSSAAARADAEELAHRCGARTVVVDAATHDAVLAAVSHAPQVVASVLAGRLATAGPDAAQLAGQGFRDTTRLADSDPELWAAIAAANAPSLAGELRAVADGLRRVADGLDAGDATAVATVVAEGRAARALLPGKARAPRPAWARVGVVLPDRPGELARLFGAAGDAGVNVEDVSIEHAPDHPVGYVDLEVRPDQVERLIAALGAAGWHAHRSN